jgi:chromosome partitioning protein
MIVIAFAGRKGGIGKTTSSQNVGASLSRKGYKVLLVDLDSQANLTTSLGIREPITANVGSYLLGQSKFIDAVITEGGLDVLPSSDVLIAQEDTIKAAPAYPFNLRKALDKVKDKYDFVVLDCPPALSGLTRIGLVAADYYFIPLEAEFLAYEGLRKFIEFANDVQEISGRSQLGGVFATRYNPNIKKKLSNELVGQVSDQLAGYFLRTYIRENIALSEAQAMGRNIFDYAPDSNGAEDYEKLTTEILTRIKA